jgi:hypothetical protein
MSSNSNITVCASAHAAQGILDTQNVISFVKEELLSEGPSNDRPGPTHVRQWYPGCSAGERGALPWRARGLAQQPRPQTSAAQRAGRMHAALGSQGRAAASGAAAPWPACGTPHDLTRRVQHEKTSAGHKTPRSCSINAIESSQLPKHNLDVIGACFFRMAGGTVHLCNNCLCPCPLEPRMSYAIESYQRSWGAGSALPGTSS